MKFFIALAFSLSLFSQIFSSSDSCFRPKIFHSYWSNYCFEHLHEDPTSCSDAFIDPKKNPFEDFEPIFLGYIGNDKLISEISPLSELIHDFSDVCDQYYCSDCKISVDRYFGIEQGEYFEKKTYRTDPKLGNIPFRKSCYVPFFSFEPCRNYLCNCYEVLTYPDRDEETQEDLDTYERIDLEVWSPCAQKSIFFPYFSLHTRKYSSFFKQHLRYISEN